MRENRMENRIEDGESILTALHAMHLVPHQHTHTHTHTHARTHAHTRKHTHAHTSATANTHTHTHTHTHTSTMTEHPAVPIMEENTTTPRGAILPCAQPYA